MNGTTLRKPTARRVVGMVAGIVIIALGIASRFDVFASLRCQT